MKRDAWILWLLAPLLLALGLHRPFSVSVGRAARLPERVAAFTTAATHAIGPRTQELLGTDDAVWRTYHDAQGREFFVVGVFHGTNWKSVHPPRICLEGSDLTIHAESTARDTSGRESGWIVAKSRSADREYLSCYAFGTAEFTTASYLAFFLHHAPRALLRANSPGFLLRVECWIGSDGLEASRARCAALLGELLPRAQELVR